MKTSTKILLTLAVVIVYVVLSVIVFIVRTDSGFRTPGILGMILMVALIFGIRAVWRKKE